MFNESFIKLTGYSIPQVNGSKTLSEMELKPKQ